jgi:hypothetical protein
MRIFEYNNLPTVRNIVFVLNLCPCNRYSINYKAVTGIEGALHARAQYVKTAKYEGINKKCAQNDAYDEDNDANDIFYSRVTL